MIPGATDATELTGHADPAANRSKVNGRRSASQSSADAEGLGSVGPADGGDPLVEAVGAGLWLHALTTRRTIAKTELEFVRRVRIEPRDAGSAKPFKSCLLSRSADVKRYAS
jgi:hypothetical protein